jgi:uncharacterized protein (TIGR03118 family)
LEQRSLLSVAPTIHALRQEEVVLPRAYQQTNLVSDQAGFAKFPDSSLVNSWGLALSSTGPLWVANNGTGTSTFYAGDVNGSLVNRVGTITVPPPMGSAPGTTSTPTGIVFNGTADFGGSFFIFDTEDGTISSWSGGSSATLKVDNSPSGAVYKGLAIGTTSTGQAELFAANFNAGTIDVFDTNFVPVVLLASQFHDSKIPAGYAPFNVTDLGGRLYVSYAKQNADKHDDVAGMGHGFVNVFSTDGTLLRRLIRHGQLDSPWGMVIAPPNFGVFSGDLLVGNFGNGRINAYNPRNGAFLGTLKDPLGKPLVIDGLWALVFGNGVTAGDTNGLFFSSGPDHEMHGLVGSIHPVHRVRR